MKLSDLIRKGVSGAVATATVATPATQRGSKAPTVANVATVAVANPPDRVMGGNPTVATVATVAVANPPQGGVAANDPTAAPASHWLIHFADRDPLELYVSPALSHAEVLAAHPDALAAEPVPERVSTRAATAREHAELLALVSAIYAADADADRQEAIDAALADPEGALTCYRAIAAERGITVERADARQSSAQSARQSVQQSVQQSAARNCSTCRHRKRPGLSAGYCGGGRDDLPPAYGLHHPLRKLPDDQGASCASYTPVEG